MSRRTGASLSPKAFHPPASLSRSRSPTEPACRCAGGQRHDRWVRTPLRQPGLSPTARRAAQAWGGVVLRDGTGGGSQPSAGRRGGHGGSLSAVASATGALQSLGVATGPWLPGGTGPSRPNVVDSPTAIDTLAACSFCIGAGVGRSYGRHVRSTDRFHLGFAARGFSHRILTQGPLPTASGDSARFEVHRLTAVAVEADSALASFCLSQVGHVGLYVTRRCCQQAFHRKRTPSTSLKAPLNTASLDCSRAALYPHLVVRPAPRTRTQRRPATPRTLEPNSRTGVP